MPGRIEVVLTSEELQALSAIVEQLGIIAERLGNLEPPRSGPSPIASIAESLEKLANLAERKEQNARK